MVRRCEFCDSPVPADATVCPVCREEIAEETLERILPLLKRPDAPDVRVLGPIDRMWGVIRRPAAAYRDIGQKPDGIGPLMVVLFNALIMAGFFLATSTKLTISMDIDGTMTDVGVLSTAWGGAFYITATLSILPNILLGFFYLVFGTAFAHLAFKILGGTGNKSKTMSIVGYSMIPVLLFRLIGILVVLVAMPTIPLSVGGALPTEASMTLAINALYANPIWLTIDYLTTAAFVWVGFLLIFGIREAHDTSTLWAATISIMCTVVLAWTFWQVH